MKVLGIGDNVCDKYLHLKKMFPGGQALNFSVYSKILGIDSAYIGVFGTDYLASHIKTTLKEFNIDFSHSRTIEGENGYAVVDIVNNDRVFLKSNKGGVLKSNPIILNNDDLEYIKNFSIIHTSNNSYFDDQLEKIFNLQIPISYDFSSQWKDSNKVEQVAKYLNYAFLSCGNLPEQEVKNICKTIHSLGCKTIIATRGNLGVCVCDGTDFFFQSSEVITPLDTLGAGDSFATAFLIHLIMCFEESPVKMKNDRTYYINTLKEAMQKGTKFAAKTCKIYGAFGHETNILE